MFTLWFISGLSTNFGGWDKFETAHNFETAKDIARRTIRDGVDTVRIKDESNGNTFTFKQGQFF